MTNLKNLGTFFKMHKSWRSSDRSTHLPRGCRSRISYMPFHPTSFTRLWYWLRSATCTNIPDLCPKCRIPRNIIHFLGFFLPCAWAKANIIKWPVLKQCTWTTLTGNGNFPGKCIEIRYCISSEIIAVFSYSITHFSPLIRNEVLCVYQVQ